MSRVTHTDTTLHGPTSSQLCFRAFRGDKVLSKQKKVCIPFWHCTSNLTSIPLCSSKCDQADDTMDVLRQRPAKPGRYKRASEKWLATELVVSAAVKQSVQIGSVWSSNATAVTGYQVSKVLPFFRLVRRLGWRVAHSVYEGMQCASTLRHDAPTPLACFFPAQSDSRSSPPT